MEKTHQVKLNLQYISMQVPYWMGYSVLSTFTSVFLLSRDFTNSQIGLVLSLANLFAAIVQPFLASFADRMIRIRLSQLAAGMALVLVLFSGILLVVPKVFNSSTDLHFTVCVSGTVTTTDDCYRNFFY